MRWLPSDDLYVAASTNPNCEQRDYCPRVCKVNPDVGVTMVGTVPK